MGWALRIRWLYLQKTEADWPWAGLPIHGHVMLKPSWQEISIAGSGLITGRKEKQWQSLLRT